MRRFSGAAWSVVGRRRPILDWRTLMVDLRHVVRSGTATDRYFGCNPSAGGRRKWPRRRGNTRRALTAALDRTLRLATHRLSAEMHPIYRGWWCAVLVCAGAGGRWGGAEITFGGGHASHHVKEVNHQRPPVQYRSSPSNYRPSSAVKPPQAAPSPLSLARRLRPMRCTRAEPNSQARNTRALFM